MQRQDILRKIEQGFISYQELCDRYFHYVFEEKSKNSKTSYKELVFCPKLENFMHLCGITYQEPGMERPLSGNQFHKYLSQGWIKSEFLNVGKDGERKAEILPQLEELKQLSIRVINQKTTFEQLVFQKGLRSTGDVFALALTYSGNAYVPLSLLNIKNHSHRLDKIKSERVLCIYEAHLKEQDFSLIVKNEAFNADEYQFCSEYEWGEKLNNSRLYKNNKLGYGSTKSEIAKIKGITKAVFTDQVNRFENVISNKVNPFSFSLNDLDNINEWIVDPIFHTGGKRRNNDIVDKGINFVAANQIDETLDDWIQGYRDDLYFMALEPDELASKLTQFISDFMLIRPYYEANKDTIKLFSTLVARNAGYDLNFKDMNQEKLKIAMKSVETYSEPLQNLICEQLQERGYNKDLVNSIFRYGRDNSFER